MGAVLANMGVIKGVRRGFDPYRECCEKKFVGICDYGF